ncbi:MAG: DegT/DnrJ/EryC1/StrS family aminotransferase [Candidatus Aenigmarchaeota archaeon]|nr:DegT/DnrJ/EryC1/StrS family aminotransferase [Candidatus Aenigmarchaeota archaeon]
MIPITKPDIGEDEIRAVEDVLRSGYIVQHNKTREFERDFSLYIGTKYGIATSSGTTSLMIALKSLGIKEGDEVITTPFTFAATGNSILYVGAKPVFVDIDPKTFNIDPDLIGEKITEKTKAILPVHLYGQPCEMKKINKLCHDNGLLLIEDAAQAHGAEYDGKKAGSFGDVSCFSFYATKNLVTAEGGMIMTNSEETEEKSRMVRDHGQSGRYIHEFLSYNFRMTDINAALGIVQLKKLDSMNKKRAENADYFTEKLKNLDWLETPFVPEKMMPSWHQYTLRILEGKRDKFWEHMKENDIQCMLYYPIPLYLQPFYRTMGFKEGLCPISERISKEVISIPVGPHLTEPDKENIADTIKGFA